MIIIVLLKNIRESSSKYITCFSIRLFCVVDLVIAYKSTIKYY